MHPTLDRLIGQFRQAQDKAVDVLARLMIPAPATNRDWLTVCMQHGLHGRVVRDGVALLPHGYGIEVRTSKFVVDFDWGAHGEPDGFDTWRLYNFTQDYRRDWSCTYEEIKQWLSEAAANHELESDDELYYDPRRRAPRQARDVAE